MARRFVRLANANTVIAYSHAVRTVSGGNAADDDLACVGMFDGVQHRFTHNLQQMHLFLRIQGQG